MQASGKIGDIEGKIYQEWKINHFFSYIGNNIYDSPCFSFVDTSWFFRMYPKSVTKPGFVSFYLGKAQAREYSVEYNFGLKKLDGSVELCERGVIRGDQSWSNPSYFKLSEIEDRKSELVPLGTLVITCTLKREATLSDQPRMMDEPNLKRLIKLDTLSENFKRLLSNKDSCDTILHVIDKEYKAHKAVLMARSTVFAAMFLHDTSEKQTGVVTISDCDPESFEEFLGFLYCGKLEELSHSNALHLYETAEKYDVQELKAFCMEYLMKNLTVESLCNVAVIADKYEDSKLLSAAQDFFNKNLSEILKTSEWDSLVVNNYRLSKDLLTKMSLKVKIAESVLG